MIDTQIKIDGLTRARMEKIINDFATTLGKEAKDGIKRMAKSACKELTKKVQPYGLNGGGPMAKFIKSIGYQVDRAWFGTNLGAFPRNTDMRSAHYAARKNGVVPERLFRKEKGKPWLGLISESERDRYKKTAQAKAFRAKAAWVKISDDLNNGKSKVRVSVLIRRHAKNAWGRFTISGEGMKTKIEINNYVPYLKHIQSTEDIQAATMAGMKNGLSYMQTTTRKHIEKVNRELNK